MNLFLKVLGVVSILLLVSTIICGLWIKSHPAGNDLGFHFRLSLTTVILALITIVLFMIKK